MLALLIYHFKNAYNKRRLLLRGSSHWVSFNLKFIFVSHGHVIRNKSLLLASENFHVEAQSPHISQAEQHRQRHQTTISTNIWRIISTTNKLKGKLN